MPHRNAAFRVLINVILLNTLRCLLLCVCGSLSTDKCPCMRVFMFAMNVSKNGPIGQNVSYAGRV